MAATVDTQRALEEYQRRAANMFNEIIMRDIAIADLERRNADLEQQLHEAQAVPVATATPPADPDATAPMPSLGTHRPPNAGRGA